MIRSVSLTESVNSLSDLFSRLNVSASTRRVFRDDGQSFVEVASDADVMDNLCSEYSQLLITDRQNSSLVGLVELFVGLSIDSQKPRPEQHNLMLVRGSQWEGYCCGEEKSEVYPFVLTVLHVDEGDDGMFEGIVEWPTLEGSINKFMGQTKGHTIRFREYQRIRGGGTEVPTNYAIEQQPDEETQYCGEIPKSTYSIMMNFRGIACPNVGLFLSNQPKLRPPQNYDFAQFTGLPGEEQPSVQSRRLNFRALTSASTYWYDKSQCVGVLEPRSAEFHEEEPTCEYCGEPATKKILVDRAGKQSKRVCLDYPSCAMNRLRYDSDDCW